MVPFPCAWDPRAPRFLPNRSILIDHSIRCHDARPWLAARHDNDIPTMVTTMAHEHDNNEDVTVVTGPTPYHAESGAVRLAA